MASNYPHQSALPTCKHHVNEQLNYYCQTCNLRVCEECCHGRHMTHKWMSNKKFAIWIRQNTETRCEELDDMIRELENEDVEMEVDISKIEEVRRKWFCAVNNTTDSMIEKRKNRRFRKTSSEEMTRMKKMLKFFKKDIIEADDKIAVEMEEEFHKKKQTLRTQNQRSEKKLIFKEGTFSADCIQQMLGDVLQVTNQSEVNVIERSNFPHIDDSDIICCIVPLQNNDALINQSQDKHFDHVDITGKVLKRLPIEVEYFIQLNEDIVFANFGEQTIRRVTPSGTESDICITAPLHPDGICKSYDGGLLITLCSCFSTEITSDSYGEVHHIDTSGGIINKYSNTEDMISRLFIHPIRVAQNKNSDLCVVEYIDREYRSRLVVVSISSQIKFTYTGQL